MGDAVSFQHEGDFGGSTSGGGDLLAETGARVSAPVFNFGSGAGAGTVSQAAAGMPWWGWALLAVGSLFALRKWMA